MSLPALPLATPAGVRISIELRVLHATARALKVAAAFDGPDSAAGAAAWLPRSQVVDAGPSGRFNCRRISMAARIYERLRGELLAKQTQPY